MFDQTQTCISQHNDISHALTKIGQSESSAPSTSMPYSPSARMGCFTPKQIEALRMDIFDLKNSQTFMKNTLTNIQCSIVVQATDLKTLNRFRELFPTQE